MVEWKILIVDDEPGILRSISRIFGGSHDLRTCGSAGDAIAAAESFQPDMAILDIRLPDMDGFELMNRLQSMDDDIAVILMTGSVHENDEKLIKAIRRKAFYFITKPFDREVLIALVDRCLELKGLQRANKLHAEQMHRQLMSASAFQQSMLPDCRANIAGFEIAAVYHPCTQIAGDFFEYAGSGDEEATVMVADVVGHGACAAMLTAIIKSAFHRAGADNYEPMAVLGQIYEEMAAFGSDQFLTLLCAKVSGKKQTMEYVNAGHNGGLMIGSGGAISPLEVTSHIVSPVFLDQPRESRTVPWTSQSELLLFTDGVVEAGNGDDLFGHGRLHAAIGNALAGDASILDIVDESVKSHLGGSVPIDDITMLHMRNTH